MKLIVRPVAEPAREIDMTHRLVAAIAEELWRLYGGNDQLNWIEAERHLERLIADARREAAESDVVFIERPPIPRRSIERPRRDAWRPRRPRAACPGGPSAMSGV